MHTNTLVENSAIMYQCFGINTIIVLASANNIAAITRQLGRNHTSPTQFQFWVIAMLIALYQHNIQFVQMSQQLSQRRLTALAQLTDMRPAPG